METPAAGEEEEIAVTLDSQDFAETMDNRDSADTFVQSIRSFRKRIRLVGR